MTRVVRIINTDADRRTIATWAKNVEFGTRVEFKKAKRTLDQNSRMWAMLSEVASQVKWHGIKLTADDFKLLFLDALKRELRMVPNLDGNGFVALGRSSSDLTIEEMTDMMTLIEKFGAERGVVFHDGEEQAA